MAKMTALAGTAAALTAGCAKENVPTDPDYAELRAGFAEEEITPGVGVSLMGYTFRQQSLRPGHTGVHDPLRVRVLAFQDASGAAALISMDVAVLPNDFARRVRAAVADELNCDRSRVLLCATHSHSGPILMTPNPRPDKKKASDEDKSPPAWHAEAIAYTKALEPIIVETARRAAALTYPVTASVRNAPLGIAYNRRVVTERGLQNCWEPEQFPHRPPELPADSTCSVLLLRQRQGNRRFLLWSTAAHPVVLGKTSRVVSADYPGSACRMIGEMMPNTHTLFTLGACGDTQPWIATQDDPQAVETVARAAASFVTLLSHGTTSVAPDSKVPLRLKTAEKTFRIGKRELDVVVWGLGSMRLVAMPVELFSELAARLRRAIDGPVILSTCSNGWGGYVPTKAAFAQGGYEVDAALKGGVKAGDGERLIDRIAKLARTL